MGYEGAGELNGTNRRAGGVGTARRPIRTAAVLDTLAMDTPWACPVEYMHEAESQSAIRV